MTQAPCKISKKKLTLSEKAQGVVGVLIIASLSATFADIFFVGDKADKLCDQIKSQFNETVNYLKSPPIHPHLQDRVANITITVPMTSKDIGSILPWRNGEDCYVASLDLK